MILEILKRFRLIVFSVLHWSHAAHIVIFVWSGDIIDIKEISFDCFQCLHWSHAAHIVIFVWSGDIRDIKEISFDCFQCTLVTCSTYSYLCVVW